MSENENPAETLRRAAGVMREIADRATAQSRTEGNVEGVWLNSRFYMTWDPTIALAVADWLDAEAAKDHPTRHLARTFGGELMFPTDPHALAVARAYLGSRP